MTKCTEIDEYIMRCFYCNNLDTENAVLDKNEERHIFSVLRAREGQEIILIDGKGGIAQAIIQKNKTIQIITRKIITEPERKIHLFVSTPRKQKMDSILSQCTEAGVWEIHPIITENSVAISNKDNAIDKWQNKIIEACKQAHNPFFPIIHTKTTLKDSLEITNNLKLSCFYGDSKGKNPLRNLDISNSDKSAMAWFVGPEGGFSDVELQLIRDNEFQPLSLGNWVMRVETASVAGIVILNSL